MSSKKYQSAIERRRALKKILAGTGAAGVVAVAPQKWTTPVIDSVVLPVHAQTSQLPLNYSDPNAAAEAPTNILETLIPAAHAGAIAPNSLCINFNADMTTYNATIQDDVQLNVVNGDVGTAEPILDFNCDAPSIYTFKVLNGPDNDGVAWEIRQEIDVALPPPLYEGVAQASDCIVDLGACLE